MNTTRTVVVPEDVTLSIESRVVTVKGPRGSITKDISHLPLDIKVIDSVKQVGKKEISITRWFANYKHRCIVKTCEGIFKNMFAGVTKGFKYKMRCVNAHFPIKIFIADDKKSVEFKNFLGGVQIKTVIMKPGCTISVNPKLKDEIIVEGVDVDNVSLS